MQPTVIGKAMMSKGGLHGYVMVSGGGWWVVGGDDIRPAEACRYRYATDKASLEPSPCGLARLLGRSICCSAMGGAEQAKPKHFIYPCNLCCGGDLRSKSTSIVLLGGGTLEKQAQCPHGLLLGGAWRAILWLYCHQHHRQSSKHAAAADDQFFFVGAAQCHGARVTCQLREHVSEKQ